jgi:hypothetical protein
MRNAAPAAARPAISASAAGHRPCPPRACAAPTRRAPRPDVHPRRHPDRAPPSAVKVPSFDAKLAGPNRSKCRKKPAPPRTYGTTRPGPRHALRHEVPGDVACDEEIAIGPRPLHVGDFWSDAQTRGHRPPRLPAHHEVGNHGVVHEPRVADRDFQRRCGSRLRQRPTGKHQDTRPAEAPRQSRPSYPALSPQGAKTSPIGSRAGVDVLHGWPT